MHLVRMAYLVTVRSAAAIGISVACYFFSLPVSLIPLVVFISAARLLLMLMLLILLLLPNRT